MFAGCWPPVRLGLTAEAPPRALQAGGAGKSEEDDDGRGDDGRRGVAGLLLLPAVVHQAVQGPGAGPGGRRSRAAAMLGAVEHAVAHGALPGEDLLRSRGLCPGAGGLYAGAAAALRRLRWSDPRLAVQFLRLAERAYADRLDDDDAARSRQRAGPGAWARSRRPPSSLHRSSRRGEDAGAPGLTSSPAENQKQSSPLPACAPQARAGAG